ncbi:hypothetical protein HN803_00430 [candidate division WWE3 bacterium]|jgi:hypothetical protein|nr:hypothetical protein [candidate division WWE3 bacterium]MBT7349250.1 hypothetical protein [candidate division WWE3 bacterium]
MFKKPALNKYPMLVVLPVIWFGTLTFTILLLITLLFFSSNTVRSSQKYSIYSSRPLVLGAMTGTTGIGDPRAEKINQVYARYNCPMEGLGEAFVKEADENNIPYWVVAAVAFQESSCGKMIPYVDDEPSYNAWGWAVYGDQVKMFDSWEHGIKVVSAYMNERFFSQGVTELCDIMKVYTPPSKGSWCAGVEYFKDAIDEYQTPLL